MPNFEYVVYVLTGLFCVLTLLVAACIILLVRCWNKLVTIHEAVMINQDSIESLRRRQLVILDNMDKILDIIQDDELENELKDDEETHMTPEFKRITDAIENRGKSTSNAIEGPGEAVTNRGLDIHMISRDEYLFGNYHEYSKHTLWYDTVKDVIRLSKGLFSNNEFTPATATFLGDGLKYFGVCSENKNVIYIRNHDLKADFMIEKASVV